MNHRRPFPAVRWAFGCAFLALRRRLAFPTTSPLDPQFSRVPSLYLTPISSFPPLNFATMNTPPQDQIIAVQQPPSKSTSRRLPPPCWSHEETVALIESYRDKWYSLRRGNLRAPHWQEVADGVSSRCSSLGNPSKTSIQCRHKMEKLRKRYRAEIQRIGNIPAVRGGYSSSWVHFKLMDSMELGLEITHDGDDNHDSTVMEDDLMLYPKGIKQAIAFPLNKRIENGNGNGNMLFDDYPPSMNLHYGMGNKGVRNGYMKEMEKDRFAGGKRKAAAAEIDDGDDDDGGSSDVMDEMVAAINKLGDGFVKMEKVKMDMARELESMRMKMEMKRTEMIIESNQKLLESFSKTVVDKNTKMKRMPATKS